MTTKKKQIKIYKTCPPIRIHNTHIKRSKRHEVRPYGFVWMDLPRLMYKLIFKI